MTIGLCNTNAVMSEFYEVLPCSTAEETLSRICWLSALRFCYVQGQKSFHMVPESCFGTCFFLCLPVVGIRLRKMRNG